MKNEHNNSEKMSSSRQQRLLKARLVLGSPLQTEYRYWRNAEAEVLLTEKLLRLDPQC